MNTYPSFSIVIPVYNKGPHIRRVMDSVFSQSFTDFEVIVVDDASDDDSATEIDKIKSNKIFTFRRDQPGAGGYAARNLGIRNSRGRWIAFLDADDEWMSDHLEKMHNLSECFADASLLSCGWVRRKKNQDAVNQYFLENGERGCHSIDCSEYLFSCIHRRRPIWTSVAVVRRDRVPPEGLFPEDGVTRRGGDIYAWLLMMCRHKQMAWSNHIGAIYHTDSVNMVTKNKDQGSLRLLNRERFVELSTNLNTREKLLLKKYFNIHLRNMWVGNRIRKSNSFFLPLELFWKGDMFRALQISIFSLIPGCLFRGLISFREKISFKK